MWVFYKKIVSSTLIICLLVTGISLMNISDSSVFADTEKAAVATPATFTLKFNANGGTVSITSKVLTQNAKAGSLPKPKKIGYTFKGWYTKKKNGTKVTSKTKIKFTKPTKTIYARWAKLKNSYKVTLNANGGKVSPKKQIVVKKKNYGKLMSLPAPTRTNYNFKGWYTKKSGGKRIKDSTKVTNSSKHTLYARWQNKYTVTFSKNGGKLASSKNTKTVTLGKSYGSLPTPTRTNYVFSGWYTKKTGGTLITNATVVSLKKNQTLYARWKSSGSILPGYNNEAKAIITAIGKQGSRQCAAYAMAYSVAIKDKKKVNPTTYLNSDNNAVWSRGGMIKKVHSYSASTACHPAAVAQIKQQIDNGLPCVIRATYSGGQHWLTVVGYLPNASIYSNLYVLDPASSDPAAVRLFWDTKYYYPASGEVAVVTFQ